MIMVTTATIAIATMRTTIAMTMGTMTVNDHGYMTATIAMTTTMTMRMHFFRAKHGNPSLCHAKGGGSPRSLERG